MATTQARDAGHGGGDGEPFSLLRRRLPPFLRLRLLLLDPGAERPYRAEEWTGALVVVEQGAIVLVPDEGRGRRLGCGAVLWLAGLPLTAIANPHPGPALLSVLSRVPR